MFYRFEFCDYLHETYNNLIKDLKFYKTFNKVIRSFKLKILQQCYVFLFE